MQHQTSAHLNRTRDGNERSMVIYVLTSPTLSWKRKENQLFLEEFVSQCMSGYQRDVPIVIGNFSRSAPCGRVP